MAASNLSASWQRARGDWCNRTYDLVPRRRATAVTKTTPDLPIITFATQADFEAWLAEHHEEPAGLWIKIAKKASGIESISHAEALDVALCYGWIDGLRRSHDENYFVEWYTQCHTPIQLDQYGSGGGLIGR